MHFYNSLISMHQILERSVCSRLARLSFSNSEHKYNDSPHIVQRGVGVLHVAIQTIPVEICGDLCNRGLAPNTGTPHVFSTFYVEQNFTVK